MNNATPAYFISEDHAMRIAAVVRRLYTEQHMSGDTMRNAAQLLQPILDELGVNARKYHATYDARVK